VADIFASTNIPIIEAALPRPRECQSAAFDFVKRQVRSSAPASPTTAKTRASASAALWW
jgi:hypothetical protein